MKFPGTSKISAPQAGSVSPRRVPPRTWGLLSLTGLLLAGCAQPSVPASSPLVNSVSGASQQTANAEHLATLTAPALPDGRNLKPLPNLDGPRLRLPLQTLSVNPNTSVVALKVLILSAGTSDSSLPAAKAMLDQVGVPYDVVNPAVAGSFTSSTLVAADGTGNYQGVLLTTGNLAYEASPGNWQSGLDWTGWNLLWQYESDYHVRQLALYTYPSSWPEDYGMRDAGGASGTASPTLTTAGAQVFTDLRSGVALPIRFAYNYPATLVSVPGVTTTPLLNDAAGRTLAVRSDTAGRERIALNFAQNPYLLHSSLVGYSLVNWLTKGVYIGEYRRYNQLDIDDWFLDGDVFDATTKVVQPDAFRLSASDALALPDQQNALRAAFPVSSTFKFAVLFNGVQADVTAPASCSPTVVSSDPLSSVTRCLGNQFDWVSHTYAHLYMDFLNYTDSAAQLKPNLTVGSQMGLSVSTKSLVSGAMSGLGYYNPAGDGVATDHGLSASNTDFLKAAQDSGTQYLASNHSVASQWDAGCANCGLTHPLNANLFLVPRWPTNVFYDVTDPTQATAAYNSVYGPGGTAPYWDHALNYSEFLDKETDIALSHLLSGGAYPHYMHQDNARQYAAGRSLAYDWEAALLAKYSAYSTLPLKTLRWDDLGAYMKARTSFMKSGLSGSWDRSANSVSLRSARGGSGYVTGAVLGSSEVYNGRTISAFTAGAGQVISAPVR
ncbi:hypothetical protein Q0M94_24765 (plasmid) [Deinococcus radiomollis]|uniref:Agd3-related carbohydrate-binding protein n=1 Tax=Deinococcus radiomollis TaxID=468916 RepID=UPI0038921055